MDLLKKFICIIILFSFIAAFFPSPSRAASSDIDIDYTKNAQTIFDIEDYLKRQQDTYLHYIKAHNSQVLQAIINNFNDGNFFYITIDYNSSKNDHIYFYITFYHFAKYYSDYPLENNRFYTTILKSHTPIPPNNNYAQIGTYYNNYIDTDLTCITLELSENDSINIWDYSSNYTPLIPTCLIGYTSNYFLQYILGDSNNGGSSSNDYSNILYTLSSDLNTLLYNSNTIMGDIANVKNYANYINNKLTTTNTYLSNIQGAITNGSSTITNTIVSTHNLDNSNDNKNTNEIVTAIKENTNSISSIQVTNDNSELINAINNGFSDLNSNNNNNKSQIVSAINNASEDVINGQNDNTNSIISSESSNKNDIVEAIENNSSTSGTGGITNSEFNNGVASINDNNNSNTNRILDSEATEEDADIFSNIDTPEFEDPLPNIGNTLETFFDNITSADTTSKTFNFTFRDKPYSFKLDYTILKDKFFSKNGILFELYKDMWWVLIGFFVYKKLRKFYNLCIAGEWDEVVTSFDDTDNIIGRSVK